MAKNVGGVDRIIRLVAGVGLMAYAMSNLPGAEDWMVPAGIVGFVLLLTGIIGWCPAYLPFGIKTCKAR
jgi:hypothetical protein